MSLSRTLVLKKTEGACCSFSKLTRLPLAQCNVWKATVWRVLAVVRENYARSISELDREKAPAYSMCVPLRRPTANCGLRLSRRYAETRQAEVGGLRQPLVYYYRRFDVEVI